MLRLLKLWRFARKDLRLLGFALRHRNRPAWLWPAAALLACYALEPANFALPVLGVVDDFVLLPLVLHVLLKCLPADIRAGFHRRLESEIPAARSQP
jgi:uncharacterized membrane protein YkvA (DUF1232 family)